MKKETMQHPSCNRADRADRSGAPRPSALYILRKPGRAGMSAFRCGLALAFLLSVLLAPLARAQTNPPQILNLTAQQRPGSMLVDITYDLVDADSTNMYILIECSSNNGTNYGVPIYSLTGDVEIVTPGTNRKIVWNAWNDWAGNYSTNARIRLTADDSMSAVPPLPTNAPAPNLRWIPSGTFNMSGTLVLLSQGFWMSQFEVTQGEFMALMTNYNPSAFTGLTNRPVENVTWFEATNYCGRLTARERAAGRITTNQTYRLPTEAEWEYACRAGTTTQFYYGDDSSYLRLRAYAWYNVNSSSQTQPVGSRIPNRWGLYDMMGNVWEWCADWYGSLPGGGVTDPTGPSSGSTRVLRGGSWSNGGSYCASSIRNANYPSSRYSYCGFRVVLAPGQ